MGRKPASQKKRLTAARVQQTKEPGKYYDENGLYLRISATGSKVWVQKVTIEGKQREMGLGSVDHVSLAQARDQALTNKNATRDGRNPMLERAREKNILTFDDAVGRVYAIHEPTWRNKKHAAQFLATLRQYASPFFGAKKVSEVTSADVMHALLPIWLNKAETARRVKQRISLIMKWAIAEGYRKDDPSSSIEQALPRTKREVTHRKSIPYDEVADCIDAVKGSKANMTTKLAIEFLVLTAARSGEVRHATWSEVDLETAVWTVPAKRMKGAIEHVVPLPERAVALLLEARDLHDGELVFPGAKPGRAMSDMTMSKLIKELGVDADVHGFRTSFRVWVQERTNASFEVAEKALAHKTKNKVVAAYARSNQLEKRRDLMQRWADHLAKDQGNVVQIGGLNG